MKKTNSGQADCSVPRIPQKLQGLSWDQASCKKYLEAGEAKVKKERTPPLLSNLFEC